jgi:Na+-translocating ferredoxin:NAD+ oxidoreductase subunit B
MNPTVDHINALLPQTQCGECGFNGCLPYAQALQAQLAPINLCPPGGINTLNALSKLLNQSAAPYLNEMQSKTRSPQLAKIDESSCIGCTKCIQACPVDAIVGAQKHMHIIINQDCTGCGLCVEPCPVDCIELLPLQQTHYDPQQAKRQYEHKQQRMLRDKHAKELNYQEKRTLNASSDSTLAEKQAKKAYILEALQRIQQKKS